MKQAFLFLLFTISGWQAQAADTTRVYYNDAWEEVSRVDARYYRISWDNGSLWMVKDYFKSGQLQMSGSYSDDSLKTKEGKFTYYHDNGKLSKTATYSKGLEEGLVKEWFDDGQLEYQGYYKSGKVDGPSQRWYPDGTPADSCHFKAGLLDGYGVWYYENGQKSEAGTYKAGKPDKVALWKTNGAPDPDGEAGELMPKYNTDNGNSLNDYLAGTLRYPEKARIKGQEGRAIVQFTVLKTGAISKVFIKKTSGVTALDAEALRVVRNMPDWKPGRFHNRPVSVYYTLPVTFKLD